MRGTAYFSPLSTPPCGHSQLACDGFTGCDLTIDHPFPDSFRRGRPERHEVRRRKTQAVEGNDSKVDRGWKHAGVPIQSSCANSLVLAEGSDAGREPMTWRKEARVRAQR